MLELAIHRDHPCDPRNYSKSRTGAIGYIVIHYVGALGGARANCVYYGREKVGASAHLYVDHGPGAEVWQSVAAEDTAWHCGRSDGKYRHPQCRNDNSIGIELCCHRDASGKWYFDPETVDRAVELCRAIMARYGIGADCVVRHYDVTGKNCPAPFVEDGAAWDGFKKRLEEDDMTQHDFDVMMADWIGRQNDKPASDWAKKSWDKAVKKGVFDGTMPQGWKTREQDAVTLDRLGLLNGGV